MWRSDWSVFLKGFGGTEFFIGVSVIILIYFIAV